jgi:tetratricopeptide (TPR) repeat protein
LHSVTGGKPEVAIEHCRAAANIASVSKLDEIDAFAGSCLAQVYMVAGRLRDAIEAGERAVSSFEARGNPWWAALTLWHLTAAANYLGDWDASLDYCRRACAHGAAIKDTRLESVSLSRMGIAHIVRGDIENGLRCCQEALALATTARDAAYTKIVQGYGKIKDNRIDQGLAELSQGLAWFESSQMSYTKVIGRYWLAESYLRHGDYRTARPLIEDILGICQASGYTHYEGRAYWLLGECLAVEALRPAEDHVEAAMQIFERVGARNDLAKAMVTKAALRQAAGDTAAARQLLQGAAAIFRALGTLDEPLRVNVALSALDRGRPIHLLKTGAEAVSE